MHTDDPLACLVEVSPEETPAETAWLDRTADLSDAFTVEFFGHDAHHAVAAGLATQTAARYLWARRRGKPRFADLDVDGFVEHVETGGTWPEDMQLLCFSMLCSFYCWLMASHRIPRRAARSIIAALSRRVQHHAAQHHAGQHAQPPAKTASWLN